MFYESDIAFKTDDEWHGSKTRVYVANHTTLNPTACDNKTFVNEIIEGWEDVLNVLDNDCLSFKLYFDLFSLNSYQPSFLK